MNNNELKGCPFCGHEVGETKGFGGVTMFYCRYVRCGAIVSFSGEKRINRYTKEAENPRENFNRRAHDTTGN